jgi:hypothetical protein
MRENKQVFIGGHAYTLTNLPATKGYKTLTKLLKIIGGPLGLVMDGPKGLSLAQMDMGKVALALTDKLDSDEGYQLAMDLLSAVYLNNRPISGEIETHFAGRIGDMIELIIESVKFQYSDVFQKLANAFQGQTLASLVTPSQPTSTGPSGESSSLKSLRSKK